MTASPEAEWADRRAWVVRPRLAGPAGCPPCATTVAPRLSPHDPQPMGSPPRGGPPLPSRRRNGGAGRTGRAAGAGRTGRAAPGPAAGAAAGGPAAPVGGTGRGGVVPADRWPRGDAGPDPGAA